MNVDPVGVERLRFLICPRCKSSCFGGGGICSNCNYESHECKGPSEVSKEVLSVSKAIEQKIQKFFTTNK